MIKIRKIEASPEDIISRIERLVEISEQIPNNAYTGTSLKVIWTTLGLKELEFWELYFENKELFDEIFEIHTSEYNDSIKTIFRISYINRKQ